MTMRLASLALALLAPLAGCLPRTGQVTVYGDGGSAPASDHKVQLPDTGPRPDGLPPQKDTFAPPKPDTSPSGPPPPFGTTLGMTAKNWTGVPDCAGKLYDLHGYYQQKKGVLIAMMSPS